jgi:DNA-binding response OmpR family regulator
MAKALVVDDELDICLMVTKHLQQAQFDSDYALSVREACEKIRITEYALILVDLNLPDGTGYDVMSFLSESNSKSKIIVISAYDHEVSEVLEHGADMFIAKPFTLKAVSNALEHLDLVHK